MAAVRCGDAGDRPGGAGSGDRTGDGPAAPRIRRIGVISPEALGRALADAADPHLARLQLSRVGEDPVAREVLGRPELLPVAVRVLGFSTAAADFLVAHPEEAAAAVENPRTRTA